MICTYLDLDCTQHRFEDITLRSGLYNALFTIVHYLQYKAIDYLILTRDARNASSNYLEKRTPSVLATYLMWHQLSFPSICEYWVNSSNLGRLLLVLYTPR